MSRHAGGQRQRCVSAWNAGAENSFRGPSQRTVAGPSMDLDGAVFIYRWKDALRPRLLLLAASFDGADGSDVKADIFAVPA